MVISLQNECIDLHYRTRRELLKRLHDGLTMIICGGRRSECSHPIGRSLKWHEERTAPHHLLSCLFCNKRYTGVLHALLEVGEPATALAGRCGIHIERLCVSIRNSSLQPHQSLHSTVLSNSTFYRVFLLSIDWSCSCHANKRRS